MVKRAFGIFYSVVRVGKVVYISENLFILIKGEVVDRDANRSLITALREANRQKIKLSDLREADAIRIGMRRRRIFVFSDPDCPSCRQCKLSSASYRTPGCICCHSR